MGSGTQKNNAEDDSEDRERHDEYTPDDEAESGSFGPDLGSAEHGCYFVAIGKKEGEGNGDEVSED